MKKVLINTKEIASSPEFYNSASVINNLWSIVNHTDLIVKDTPDKGEAYRSTFLLVLDILENFKSVAKYGDDLLAKYKMPASFTTSKGINSTRALVVTERLIKNLSTVYEDANSDGYVMKSVIAELFADFALIANELLSIFSKNPITKLSPLGISINVFSALLTSVSNVMNIDASSNEENTIHISELLDFIIDAGIVAIKGTNGVSILIDLVEDYLPDIVNPWKEPDAIDLIGTNEDDIINNEEGLFDKERYVIFAHNGNDTITGGRYNDYLDGGADDDKLYGGAGSDILIGGTGDDLLDGGEGSDRLYGGEGMDIYIAQHHDTITDSDGKGSIFLKTEQGLIHAARFVQDKLDDPNTWFSVDRHGLRDDKLIAQRDDEGNLTVFLDGFHDSVVIKNFFTMASQNGDTYRSLGVTLAQDDGSSRPLSTDLNVGNQVFGRYSSIYVGDAAKSYTINGGVLDDLIMVNNAQFTQILAGSGNDRVFGSLNGDRIYGGDGNDVLNGSRFINSANPGLSAEKLALDTDIIVGNGGRDIINGFAGDDVIFTEEWDSHLTEIGTDKGGDWATGGLGDDKIFGSENRDFLLGGEGRDTIYGGAGNDVIIGDGFVRAGQKTHTIRGVLDTVGWDYNHVGIGIMPIPVHQSGQPVGNEYRFNANKGEVAETTPIYTFNTLHPDTWSWSVDIDTEAGDYAIRYSGNQIKVSNNEHRVAIGGDGDFLYGGAGDDLIIGQDGNDYINGGSGNDILFGDDNRDDSVSGNDTLIAGSGSDRLYGGNGFDIYQFDSQDLLQGDVNIIKDSDNQGAVILDGLALGDLGWTLGDVAGLWLNEDKGLSLHLQNDSLLVSGDTFGGKIFIQNFVDGALGIKLPEQNNTDKADAGNNKEKLTVIVTGKGSGAFETESGKGAIDADSYSYDDGGMGYWTPWGINSGAFGD